MKRLFFLEDDRWIFEEMKRLLEMCAEGEELVCEQYVSMEEAEKRILQGEQFDAFVLNIRVEGSFYTGRSLAALIREQERYTLTPIIFVSNFPLMQTWLENTLGYCWFVKKAEMTKEFPKLMTRVLGFAREERLSAKRLLVKKKESIELWVMVRDLIALQCVKRDELCLFTVTEGKRIVRGARGMMGLVEEQIYQERLDCLQFINHSEIINLNFFKALEKREKESMTYEIRLFGCEERFIPSRQYLQKLKGWLEDN